MFSSRNTLAVFFVAAMSSLYLGCGGSDGKDGANGQNGQNGQDGKDGISTLVISTQEPAGQRCANGGLKVEIGPDADGDGILAESEIKATQYICNGTNGQPGTPGTPGVSQTISTSAVAAGADGCVNGGIKITISDGTDSRDAVICNGENGTSSSGDVPSIATSVVPAGDTNCANGGVKIDVTSGGSTSTQYACNGTNGQPGAPGTSPSIATTKLESGDATCANGGVKIEISVAGTVTDTRYVCNGANGSDGTGTPGTPGANGHNSLISMTDYTGAACASGTGLQIVSWLDLNDNGKLDAEEETANTTTSKIICNGNNGGGASGCAAEGEDYCLTQALENDNNLGVCDTTTGNCVECITNDDCGTTSGKYCSEKTCISYCGDGIVNNGEDCDPRANKSDWRYGGTCDGWMAGTVGDVTCSETCVMNVDSCDFPNLCGNGTVDTLDSEVCDPTADKSTWTKTSCADVMGAGYTGELGCQEGCKNFDLTGCTDPCANVTSDLKCTGGNGEHGEQTCDTAFGYGGTGRHVVCTPHATCEGVYELDITASDDVCSAPIDWCNTQWPLEITAANTDVFARISPAAEASIQGVRLIYGTDTTSLSSWAHIDAAFDKDDGGNKQYKATMNEATYNALAAGTYYYAMAVSGDGEDWFYCPMQGLPHGDNDNDKGGIPSQIINTDLMGTMVIENDVPPAPTGHVVINQIMTRGNTASDEFIELYNQTSSAVDLSSYALWKSTGTNYPSTTAKIALTGTIPAKGYYLISSKKTDGSSTGLSAFNSVTPDQYVENNNGLFGGMNASVILFLTNTNDVPAEDSMANVIDYVGAGNATIYEGEVLTFTDNKNSNNTSVSRTNGVDTDNNKNDFTALDVACPRSSTQTTCPGLKPTE